MGSTQLVTMANDIAAFFVAENAAEAASNIASHLKRYWDPRMRKQIVAHLGNGGEGLTPAARDAIELLAADQARVVS